MCVERVQRRFVVSVVVPVVALVVVSTGGCVVSGIENGAVVFICAIVHIRTAHAVAGVDFLPGRPCSMVLEFASELASGIDIRNLNLYPVFVSGI